MKNLHLFSVALSVSCGIGVLMAIILTNNESSQHAEIVVVPTPSPIVAREKSLERLLREDAKRRLAEALPPDVDPIVTASIPKKEKAAEKIDINNIIANNDEELNPYPGDTTVTVKAGDTLFAISRRTGINVYKLAKLNSIKAPYVIRPGQILQLDSGN